MTQKLACLRLNKLLTILHGVCTPKVNSARDNTSALPGPVLFAAQPKTGAGAKVMEKDATFETVTHDFHPAVILAMNTVVRNPSQLSLGLGVDERCVESFKPRPQTEASCCLSYSLERSNDCLLDSRTAMRKVWTGNPRLWIMV